MSTMENSKRSVFTPMPKYKKRKFSGRRDFPSGCGRNFQPLNPRPARETENGVSNMLEDLHEVVAATLNEEIAPSLMDHSFFSPVPSNGFVAVSNGNGLDKREPRKIPRRRRLSAVRDFPPNCGTNASRNSKEENGETVTETVKIDGQEISEAVVISKESESRRNDETRLETVKTDEAKAVQDRTLGQETSNEGAILTDIKRDSQPRESSSKRKSSGPARLSHVSSDYGAKTETENADLKQPKEIGGDDHETKTDQEEAAVKQREAPFEDELVWWDHEFDTVVGKDDGDDDDEDDDDDVEGGKKLAVEGKKTKMTARKSVNANASNVKKPAESESGSEGTGQLVIWDKEKPLDHIENDGPCMDLASNSADFVTPLKSKGKKLERNKSDEAKITKTTARKTVNANASNVKKKQRKGQLVIWDRKKKYSQRNENEDRHTATTSRSVDIIVPPFNPKFSIDNRNNNNNEEATMRHKVREVLRHFQAIFRKLLQEMETKLKEGKPVNRRIDLQAANFLKQKGRFVNEGKQIFGPVPGVEVGDEFQYRIELTVIGLHRQIQGGIDYGKRNGKILAASIVASGGYNDDLENSDILIYTGQGGNVMNAGKEPEDQKLERGNLALKNSLDDKNPVRVIRGFDSAETKSKTYVYDGLYLVEKLWQDVGTHGKLVFQFQLRRISAQPELAWKEVKKSKKYKARSGLCHNDISHGKESTPICAVNTVDDEKPPFFKYVTSVIYPDWYKPNPPKGCKCTNRCSDSATCSCAVSNGGEIPYTQNGSIVELKALVVECGPACRCSSSCPNRSSQRGIKFQLEIFKTEKRGWGVRSLNFIPSGSFICEYVGELLKDSEAEQRTGNDEYLFDIGNNFNESSLFDGLETIVPDLQTYSPEASQEGGYTIDAGEYGNIGRFINHSCSPNLYAQNVLYDNDDKRIPHIMFFAAENIPALQELTYHYNYTIDTVQDSNGKIKKKSCFCGSAECTGRLY